MVAFWANGFHLHGFARWLRRGDDRFGREIEGYTEDVRVFGVEKIFLVQVVGLPTQSAPNHLLAKKLRAETTNAKNMGNRVCIPSFGQHGHRYDATNCPAKL